MSIRTLYTCDRCGREFTPSGRVNFHTKQLIEEKNGENKIRLEITATHIDPDEDGRVSADICRTCVREIVNDWWDDNA